MDGEPVINQHNNTGDHQKSLVNCKVVQVRTYLVIL